MAVQQLGPEASRAGARRARALAARAGGPTVALVALSTVTVTSLVAIAFAPLPHAVTPGIGGGVAAPSDVRVLVPAKPTPSPTSKKPAKTGSSFTSTPPAAGNGRTTTTGRTSTGSGTTTHHSGGGNTGGSGGGGGNGGGGNSGGGSGIDHGGGNGNGTPPGGTHGGTDPEGAGNGGGTVCDNPEHPLDDSTSPINVCIPHGWHGGGGGHIIVKPGTPITGTPLPAPGTGTSGTGGTGTTPGIHHGTNPGGIKPPTQGPVDPSGDKTVAAATATVAVVKADVKTEVKPAVQTQTTASVTTGVKADTDKADHAGKTCGKHRVYGEHRIGGKHRA